MIEMRLNISDFTRQLEKIKDDLKRKAIRSATGKASSVMRKASEIEAPRSKRAHMLAGKRMVMPGYLKSNVYQYRAKAKYGEENFKISVRGGRSAKTLKSGAIRDAYYWVWVHQGHTVGGKVQGGKRRAALERKRRAAAGKTIQPNPFFSRAFRTNTQAALRAFEDRLNQAVNDYSRIS